MSSFLDREGWTILFVGVMIVALLAAGAYVLWTSPTESTPAVDGVTPDTTSGSLSADSTMPAVAPEFVLAGEDGQTVLALLKRGHEVRLDSELLLFGSIVLQIDSFTAAPNQYWVYYRDSLLGDRPPDACTTYTGETIRWVLTNRR